MYNRARDGPFTRVPGLVPLQCDEVARGTADRQRRAAPAREGDRQCGDAGTGHDSAANRTQRSRWAIPRCYRSISQRAAKHFGVEPPPSRRDKKSGAKKRKQTDIERERLAGQVVHVPNKLNRYQALIQKVFFDHFTAGTTEFKFLREELEDAAICARLCWCQKFGRHSLFISLPEPLTQQYPRNSARWATSGSSKESGKGRYKFKLVTTTQHRTAGRSGRHRYTGRYPRVNPSAQTG